VVKTTALILLNIWSQHAKHICCEFSGGRGVVDGLVVLAGEAIEVIDQPSVVEGGADGGWCFFPVAETMRICLGFSMPDPSQRVRWTSERHRPAWEHHGS
jgi:hypothetical protein